MKHVFLLFTALLSMSAHAKDVAALTPAQLQARIIEITAAQNAVTKLGSTRADVDRLFANYTGDFTYVHPAYGGTYTRQELYGNTVRNLETGRYTLDGNRYTNMRTIPGLNAIAVERRENTGAVHLAVFEFRGVKVSRIIEYWK